MPTRVMATGHRPPRIGGYQTPNPMEQWVRENIRSILSGLLTRHPDLEGISGMALGTDQIFAEVCVELGIPFLAAVPFKGQESRWPRESQEEYKVLLDKAKKVVIVDDIGSYHSEQFGGKMAMRNRWMIDHSKIIVAVWNGTAGGTGNTVKMARSRGRKILRIDPQEGTVRLESPPPPPDTGPNVLDMFGNSE